MQTCRAGATIPLRRTPPSRSRRAAIRPDQARAHSTIARRAGAAGPPRPACAAARRESRVFAFETRELSPQHLAFRTHRAGRDRDLEHTPRAFTASACDRAKKHDAQHNRELCCNPVHHEAPPYARRQRRPARLGGADRFDLRRTRYDPARRTSSRGPLAYFAVGFNATRPSLTTTSNSICLPPCFCVSLGSMSRTVLAIVSSLTLSTRSLLLRRAAT